MKFWLAKQFNESLEKTKQGNKRHYVSSTPQGGMSTQGIDSVHTTLCDQNVLNLINRPCWLRQSLPVLDHSHENIAYVARGGSTIFRTDKRFCDRRARKLGFPHAPAHM